MVQRGQTRLISTIPYTYKALRANVTRKRFAEVAASIGVTMSTQEAQLTVPKLPAKAPTEHIIEDSPVVKFSKGRYRISRDEMAKPLGKLPPDSNYPPVTSETKPVTRAKDIKGINSQLYHFPTSRLKHHSFHILNCRFFELSYYPPDSFMGRIRKSKPALLFVYNNDALLNTTGLKKQPGKLQLKNPFQFMVHRKNTQKLYKQLFWNAYTEAGGVDGVYKLRLLFVPHPRDTDEIQGLMTKALKATTAPQWQTKVEKHFKTNDVIVPGRVVNIKLVNSGLPTMEWPQQDVKPKQAKPVKTRQKKQTRQQPKRAKAPHKPSQG